MEDLTKYLIELLNERLTNKSAPDIAAFIARLIVTNRISVGAKLPTQTEMSDGLGVAPAVIQEAWRLLREVYKLVRPQRGNGTYIVSQLSHRLIDMVEEKLGKLQSEYIVHLDRPIPTEINSAVSRSLAISEKKVDELSTIEKNETNIPALNEACATFTSAKIGYEFSNDEVYYNTGYLQFIYYLCTVLVSPGSFYVVVRPYSETIPMAVKGNRRKITYVGLNGWKNWLDELEEKCRENKIAVVHINPLPLYPLSLNNTSEKCKRLLAMQREYKFIILLDDRFPELVKPLDLFPELSAGTNQSVVYLRPVTIIDKRLYEVNFIAGPVDIIKKVKLQFSKVGKHLDLATGHALVHMLQKGVLQRAEQKVFKESFALIAKVKDLLKTYGYWRMDLIVNQQFWFFYLVPVAGNIPTNHYNRLAELGIHVISPKTYNIKVYGKAGILFSIAHYSIEKLMIRDVSKLLDTVENMSKRK